MSPPCLILCRFVIALLRSALSCALLCMAANAQTPSIADREGLPIISWENAETLIERKAVVTGRVVNIGDLPHIHFINFSRERDKFTAVVFTENLEKFPEPLRELYLDQLVEITGVITKYEGKPQIVVSSPGQIRVVDQLSKPFAPPLRPRPVGNEIGIASYNIRNLFDDVDHPYHEDEGTPSKPREEMVRVAATIREVNADVLALQEVETRGYLKRFVEVFLTDMGYKHVVHFEGNDLRGIDVGLVSRVPIGRVVSHRHLTFQGPDGAWRRFNRDVLRVELLPRKGDPFEVWVVHLKSNHGGREAAEPIRLAEAQQLRKLIELRLSANPNADFVICGDFNDTKDSATLRTITGEPGSQQLRSFHDEVPREDHVTYNREPYREMIDFILCSPEMAKRYISNSYRIHDGSLEQNGSDHNPLSCRFSTQSRSRATTASRE